MGKPNPARSIHDLLQTNWSLLGDLAIQNVDWFVEQRFTTQTNKPTIFIQKGRELDHVEGLPKGVLHWVEHEVYVQPFHPIQVSGANDRMWEMKREVLRIVSASGTTASGIEAIWPAPRSPRSGNLQEPYRGNEVVIQCFWREN